jgi:DNA repair protein RadC
MSAAFAVSRPPPTLAARDDLAPHEAAVVAAAKAILLAHMRAPGVNLSSVEQARDLAFLHLAGLDRECFAVAFLDAQHRLIAFDELFFGTLTATAVYVREVARRALTHNAAAVVLAHNHPSGVAEPSRADEALTEHIRNVLAPFQVTVLDHLIVGQSTVLSFAERGLI